MWQWDQCDPGVLIGGRREGRTQRVKGIGQQKQRLKPCPLKCEAGAMSQGMQTASSRGKRERRGFSPRALGRNRLGQGLGFKQGEHFGLLASRTVRGSMCVVFSYRVCRHLSQHKRKLIQDIFLHVPVLSLEKWEGVG